MASKGPLPDEDLLGVARGRALSAVAERGEREGGWLVRTSKGFDYSAPDDLGDGGALAVRLVGNHRGEFLRKGNGDAVHTAYLERGIGLVKRAGGLKVP